MLTDWTPADRKSVLHVLDLIPSGRFLLTSAHGESRAGALVRFVQQCAVNPPMVFVGLEKGQPLSPIIRDSRIFAVCPLHPDDATTVALFDRRHDYGSDPFLGVPMLQSIGGAPVPIKALGYVDCELVRHLDIDSDHEVYVGMVHSAWRNANAPSARSAHCFCAPELGDRSRRATAAPTGKSERGPQKPVDHPRSSVQKHTRRVRPPKRKT